MVPKTQKQWYLNLNSKSQDLFPALAFNPEAPVPELGEYDVLVKFHAASLNYRDLMIASSDYPRPRLPNIVPGSDGAGTILSVGSSVTRFQPGDRVVTLFNQTHLSDPITKEKMQKGMGSVVDGCFREYGVYNEQGLTRMPRNLDWLEASTLSCAATTAWNAVFGARSAEIRPGDWVLVQGTGGVSVFALQFAKAAGATVIATTSSKAKEEKLKQLGADHVINYKETPEWGDAAKKLTPGEEGVAMVVEVGGPVTMAQSIKAVKVDGVITIIGWVGGSVEGPEPSYKETVVNVFTARGVFVGSRDQMERMIKAIEAHDIHPVVDEKVFTLEQLREAYQHQHEQKHVGKVCIRID